MNISDSTLGPKISTGGHKQHPHFQEALGTSAKMNTKIRNILLENMPPREDQDLPFNCQAASL
jgi:hypothetical protein